MDDRVYVNFRAQSEDLGEKSFDSTIETNYDPRHRGFWVKFNLTHGPITSVTRFIPELEVKRA